MEARLADQQRQQELVVAGRDDQYASYMRAMRDEYDQALQRHEQQGVLLQDVVREAELRDQAHRTSSEVVAQQREELATLQIAHETCLRNASEEFLAMQGVG